jgi:hypothetical protein
VKQSRTMSLVESMTNILVGYALAFATQLAIFPLIGVHLSMGENLGVALAFTLVSLARSYALRRVFEGLRT